MMGHRMRRCAADPAVDTRTFAFVDSASDADTQSSYTFTAMDIGSADAGRTIYVGVIASGSSSRTISGVTVDGGSATLVVKSDGDTTCLAIYKIAIAAGTTADVVVTFSGTYDRCDAVTWRTVGTFAALDNATDTTFTGQTLSVTNDTYYKGFTLVLANCYYVASAPTLSSQVGWSVDAQVGSSFNRRVAGSQYPDDTASGATQSATFSNHTNGVLIAATFQ